MKIREITSESVELQLSNVMRILDNNGKNRKIMGKIAIKS